MALNGMSVNGFSLNGRTSLQHVWAHLLGEDDGNPTPVVSTPPSRGALHAAQSKRFLQYRHNEIDEQEYQRLEKKDEYLVLRLGFQKQEYRMDRVVQYSQPDPTITVTNINTAGPKVSIYNIRKS
jgi:hypothetical protein